MCAGCRAFDDCPNWIGLLQLPDNSQKKAFFLGVVYSSWAILAITA